MPKEKIVKKVDDEEAGKDESYQIFSAMSYAIILFVLGIPLWWKATEVYRVPLPYSRIASLDDLEVKFVMNISIATLDPPRGEKLVSDLQDIFKTSKLFDIVFFNTIVDRKDLAAVKSIADLEKAAFHPLKPGTLLLFEVPGLARLTPNQILVGNQRSVYFSTDTAAAKLAEVVSHWLLQEASLQRLKDTMLSPTLIDQDQGGRRRVRASKEYEIMVTAVNPDPEAIDMILDLQRAIQEYLNPFLSQLSILADYTVKSQWLYFVTLNVEPKMVPEGQAGPQHYALSEEILPLLITPLEKKLASHVSANPCVNFVVYVPTCSRSPLRIYRRQGMRLNFSPGGLDAFLSPRWGGIAIYNPSSEVCHNDTLTEPKPVVVETSRVMGTFMGQLRQLLGIQEIEESLIAKAGLHQLGYGSLRRWELDSLLRVRTLEQTTSATLTLQSLSQLLGEISNIVINDAVGLSIENAVSAVELTAAFLKAGEMEAAFKSSKAAFLAAEAAFTDPSLLALLYFPDDQKYAVYIPMFLPVMIPVLLSLKQIKDWILDILKPRRKLKAE